MSGTTVNRYCSSGLQAIAMAAHRILVDGADVAIGGGTESITLVQNDKMRFQDMVNPEMNAKLPGLYMGMGMTAEVVAERYKISREDQDVYSLKSQQRVALAQEKGWFDECIAPITVKRAVKAKDGSTQIEEGVVVRKDECNRPDTTLEGLAKLKPSFKPDGTVTAGNASQLSDGASATVLMEAGARQGARDRAARHLPRLPGGGLQPRRDGDRSGLRRAEAAREVGPEARRRSTWSS